MFSLLFISWEWCKCEFSKRSLIEIKKIINNLENVGYTVTGGKGAYANSLMRIGILGQISIQEIDEFFVILEEELKK